MVAWRSSGPASRANTTALSSLGASMLGSAVASHRPGASQGLRLATLLHSTSVSNTSGSSMRDSLAMVLAGIKWPMAGFAAAHPSGSLRLASGGALHSIHAASVCAPVLADVLPISASEQRTIEPSSPSLLMAQTCDEILALRVFSN